MRCVKCGVIQSTINIDRLSCRVHDDAWGGGCKRCRGIGNCHHEWVYFYNFWRAVRLFKSFFTKKDPFIGTPYNDEEYVEL